jgi:hypothetical protein
MMRSMRVALFALLVFLGLGGVSVSSAGESEDAERYRLQAEMDRLARRNAWKGVERVYKELEALGEMSITSHLLGSQAAQSRGEMLPAMKRLEFAVAVGEVKTDATDESETGLAEAQRALEVFTSRYGKVDISVDKTRISMLVRTDGMPFSAQERESIVHAREHLVEGRVFQGLLPIGNYMIDGERFEIVPNLDWHMVKVGPHK